MSGPLQRYFDSFNAGDISGMLDCLCDDVQHDPNEGPARYGKDAFRDFCTGMNLSFQEQLSDLVLFTSDCGRRAAAEYIVNGVYSVTAEGLPEARGQTYRLPAGSFFALEDGKIARVTTYYNLAEWLRQVQ
jgi:steroid delta-isomerase-like uncharacterized protein